jgi:beta-glucanase (GH16 family)
MWKVSVVVALLFVSFLSLAGCTQEVAGPGPGWELVWSDEFDGEGIDPERWVHATGGWGWGNAELQYYTDRPENSRLEDGMLVIEARREEKRVQGREYTSARLKTQDLHAWTYGRFEARIKLPYGQGIWPAFWMLGSNIPEANWPRCGEIDVMENIGREPTLIHGTVHGPGYSGAQGVGTSYSLPGGERFSEDFHVYAVEWEPEEIRWYVDGDHYLTVTPEDVAGEWVFDHPFFMLLNVAVGGNWPGYPDESTVFPQAMLVDYVRVYEAVGAGD